MVWPISVDWTDKRILDIDTISKYDQLWFNSLVEIGLNSPKAWWLLDIAPSKSNYWWVWGNE